MDVEKLQPVAWYRVTLNDQADVKERLLEWAEDEGVEFAWLQCVGQLRYADVASGHRKNRTDSDKIMQELTTNRHVLAVGSLVRRGEEGEVHLHGALGRGSRTVTGCLAKNPRTLGGLEVLVTVLE